MSIAFDGATVYGADDEHSSSAHERVSRFLIFVHSVWMDRFGMLGAWIFFVQTAAQLYCHVAGAAIGPTLNLVFNTVYTIFYSTFLLAYWEMEPHHTPRASYVTGVALYAIGYGVFCAYFAPSILSTPAALVMLFKAGSWLFLGGSLVLIYATEFAEKIAPERSDNSLPAHSALWIMCMDKHKSADEVEKNLAKHQHIERLQDAHPSMVRSMMLAGLSHSGLPAFLAGSVLFECAAVSASPVFTHACCTAGYTLFLAGRVLFLRGSQTDICDIFFRTGWRFDVKNHQWRVCKKKQYALGIGYQ